MHFLFVFDTVRQKGNRDTRGPEGRITVIWIKSREVQWRWLGKRLCGRSGHLRRCENVRGPQVKRHKGHKRKRKSKWNSKQNLNKTKIVTAEDCLTVQYCTICSIYNLYVHAVSLFIKTHRRSNKEVTSHLRYKWSNMWRHLLLRKLRM